MKIITSSVPPVMPFTVRTFVVVAAYLGELDYLPTKL